MENLLGKFWTSEEEMIKEIEENFYDVMDVQYSTIELMRQDGWDNEIEVYQLCRANKSISILY